MSLQGPVLLDPGVTKVADLVQHGVHEGGAQGLGVGLGGYSKLVFQVFSDP